MTVKIALLSWWCDVCSHGMEFDYPDECKAMGEMHAQTHEDPS